MHTRTGQWVNRAWRRVGLALVLTALAVTGVHTGVSQAQLLRVASQATTTPVAGINEITSIACAPTTTTCIVLGSENNVDGNFNEIVVVQNGVPGPPIAVPTLYLNSQLACSSATSCVIAGTDGFYTSGALLPVTISNTGAATFGAVDDIAGTSELNGVACPSATECVADGTDITGFNTNHEGSDAVLVDIPGGAAGTPGSAQIDTSIDGLGPISCNSATRCLANGTDDVQDNGTGDVNSVLPVSLPGATPGAPEVVSGIGFLQGVSCVPGTTTCVVVGYGSGSAADDGAAVAISGTTQQTTENLPEILDGVSCPTVSFCVGVGTSTGSPEQAYAVAFGPGTPIGTGTTDPNVGTMDAVECQSAQSCLEVGSNANDSDVDDLPLTAPTATLSGTITLAGSTPTTVSGAPVQACASDGSFCLDGTSGTAGAYTLSVPLGESYVVTAFSPAADKYTEASSAVTASMTSTGLTGIDVALEPAPALGSGISVTSPTFGTESSANAIPTVNWGQPFDVQIPASAFNTPSGDVTTVETLVITGTNTSTGQVQSVTIYAGGETTTASGQPAANGLVVGASGVSIPVPPLSPIHGPVSMVVNSISTPVAPTGIAVGGADPVIFTQGAVTQQPSVVATDFGVDHTVGTASISGADASSFSLASGACAPQSTIVQQSAANPGSDQACSFSVTWTPPATVAKTPQPYYYATLTVPVTNSSGKPAQLLVPLLGCDLRVTSATLCHQQSPSAASTGATGGSTPIGSLYVDPSGLVETTVGGTTVPLSGATVTLSQLGSGGTYAAVPNGSDVMSPANRVNPLLTGASGDFGWDTLAGTYEITATDSACTNSATSAPETVPPPATGIALLLNCPGLTQKSTSTSLGAAPGSAPPGQAVDLTATVTGGTAPTGTVTFSSGSTPLASVPVNGSGVATYTTSTLPPGLDTVTATYSGDSANAGSHGQQTVTVQSAPLLASSTAITATPSTSTSGASVTYAATVTSPSTSSDPTGSVSFTATLGTSRTPLCNATIQGTTASCTAASAPVGADTITATYGGDTNFSASSGTTTETVSAPATSTPPGTGTTSTPTGTSNPTTTGGSTPSGTSTPTGTTAPTGTTTAKGGSAPTAPLTSTATATLGNEKITLATPPTGVCLAPSAAATVSFVTTAVKGSEAAALKFTSAKVYLDKGVKHTTKLKKRVKKHGKTVTETVAVISYTPNTTLTKASDAFSLSLKGLTKGAHTLKLDVTYDETVTRHKTVKVHGKLKTQTVKSTKTVSRELSVPLTIC